MQRGAEKTEERGDDLEAARQVQGMDCGWGLGGGRQAAGKGEGHADLNFQGLRLTLRDVSWPAQGFKAARLVSEHYLLTL